MRIGIIAEGRSDVSVVKNVLIGITGLDDSDFEPLRPEYGKDATDLAWENPPDSFSTWSEVRSECISRKKIDKFFLLEGNDFIAIHIDTAEAQLYDIVRPPKNKNYCSTLQTLIVNKIDAWLGNKDIDKILHAVAIEETDAWLLTIYDNGTDSAISPNPKKKLNQKLGRLGINSSITSENYFKISYDFRNRKKVIGDEYLKYNFSLNSFWEEVEKKLQTNNRQSITIKDIVEIESIAENLEMIFGGDISVENNEDSLRLTITNNYNLQEPHSRDDLVNIIQRVLDAFNETHAIIEIPNIE